MIVVNFWTELEKQIIFAKDADCLIVVEMDANAKINFQYIKQSPHLTSNNGELLINLIKRQELFIVNSHEKCQGTITRE